ncbi:MAG TPA: SIS domain-containing protein [Bauldia sp.]|nr:SIS domain-containing protein [Bauldia sp.]
MSGNPLPSSSLMLRETAEAPDVVARLLDANAAACGVLGERLRRKPPAFAVTCARGSSDSAATYAKYLIEICLGPVVASVGPSVSSVYGRRPKMRGALFIAISQSGRSPDILTLAEAARDDDALTVAIVNDMTSPLAGLCQVALPLHAGPETSVAATKSYIASLAAVLQLVALWSGDPALDRAVRRLPDDLDDALRRSWLPAVSRVAAVESLYVVGRGPSFGAAQEAALKFKETGGLHAEALSSAELRHGPLTLAGPRFPVLLFSQNDAALSDLAGLGSELTGRGVPVITAGPVSVPGALTLPTASGIDPFAQPIALVQSFYPLAEAVARERGRDPDRPPHLKKVTETR